MESRESHIAGHRQQKIIECEAGSGLIGQYLGMRSGLTPTLAGNDEITVRDFRFNTSTLSKSSWPTNAISPLYEPSFRTTHWPTGRGFADQYSDLRSRLTTTVTGNSENTVPDFRFQTTLASRIGKESPSTQRPASARLVQLRRTPMPCGWRYSSWLMADNTEQQPSTESQLNKPMITTPQSPSTLATYHPPLLQASYQPHRAHI